jgi:tetratricopeptide (TPR) repeat protein/DNA-binding CsgD family transcriptional regulator
MKKSKHSSQIKSQYLKDISTRILKSIREDRGEKLNDILEELQLLQSHEFNNTIDAICDFIGTYQSRAILSIDQMKERVERQCKIFAKHRLYELMGRAKLVLAVGYLSTYNKYTEAMQCIFEIESIVQKYLNNDNMILCEALFTKASVYYNHTEYEKSANAILHAQSLKVFLEASPELKYKSHINLTRDYVFLGEYRKAEKHLSLAEQSWELYQSDYDKGPLFMRKSDIHRLQGDWERAREILLDCIDFYSGNGMKLRLAEFHKELGEFYGRIENPIKNFTLSLHAFEEARVIAKELNILRLEGAILNSIRILCMQFEEWKMCVQYMVAYEKTQDLIRDEEIKVHLQQMEHFAQQEQQRLLLEGKPTYIKTILEEAVQIRNENEQLRMRNIEMEKTFSGIESLIEKGGNNKRNFGTFLEQLHQIVVNTGIAIPNLQKSLLECDTLHPNFTALVMKTLPTITRMEMKVAKLIRLEFSSPSIAMLCGVTVKSIENHRMKLRKKANLKPDQSLSAFLHAI